MYLFTVKWNFCCLPYPNSISQFKYLVENLYTNTLTQVNVHRGTHTSLHLFVVYACFKSFYIIILQWVQFNVQWRYNVAVYIVYRAGQGLGPYIQYKDYWQVSIVYLNFDVIIRIRIKSKGQRCVWLDWRHSSPTFTKPAVLSQLGVHHWKSS